MKLRDLLSERTETRLRDFMDLRHLMEHPDGEDGARRIQTDEAVPLPPADLPNAYRRKGGLPG